MRRVPLGTRGDRIVLLVLEQQRDGRFDRDRTWTIRASLQDIDREGSPVGQPVTLPGTSSVRERSYTRDASSLVQRGLALVRRQPGFKPFGAPRLTHCAVPSPRCGEVRVLQTRAGTAMLRFRRTGESSTVIPFPRWSEYVSAVGRAGFHIDISPVSGRGLVISHVVDQALSDRRLLVINVSDGYLGASAERWSTAQCRSVDTCLPPEPEGAHHLGWDLVVMRPLTAGASALPDPSPVPGQRVAP